VTVPRWLARFWVWGGWLGLAATVTAVVVGWQLTSTFRLSTEGTLDLIAATLETTSETTTTAIGTLSVAEAGMVEAEFALEAAGSGLDRLSDVMTEMAFVLAGEVPATLEAVAESFPAMIDTARVIDRTMNALSFLGVNYSPETPLDVSLSAVEAEIVPLAASLRAQAIPLAESAVEINSVGDSVATVGARVAEITTQLSNSRGLIEQYEQSATDASLLIQDLRNRLDSQVLLVRILLIALGIAGLVLMTVPVSLGRRALATVAHVPQAEVQPVPGPQID
jgi:hypothetical protein